jgi:hypothetical protein
LAHNETLGEFRTPTRIALTNVFDILGALAFKPDWVSLLQGGSRDQNQKSFTAEATFKASFELGAGQILVRTRHCQYRNWRRDCRTGAEIETPSV